MSLDYLTLEAAKKRLKELRLQQSMIAKDTGLNPIYINELCFRITCILNMERHRLHPSYKILLDDGEPLPSRKKTWSTT
jgi:hypothetical protein